MFLIFLFKYSLEFYLGPATVILTDIEIRSFGSISETDMVRFFISTVLLFICLTSKEIV